MNKLGLKNLIKEVMKESKFNPFDVPQTDTISDIRAVYDLLKSSVFIKNKGVDISLIKDKITLSNKSFKKFRVEITPSSYGEYVLSYPADYDDHVDASDKNIIVDLKRLVTKIKYIINVEC